MPDMIKIDVPRQGPLVRAENMRRWEAAQTNRLNKGHWRGAQDVPINQDLSSDLNTLRTRTTFEARRNPTMEGVIWTYRTDVSGTEGPILRVISDDPAYNEALQDLWWEWFRNPDISGRLGGVDYIRLWVENLLKAGEFLVQKVSKRKNPGPVAMRIKGIQPRRLDTPPTMTGDPNVVMGIRMTEDGERLTYYIAQPLRFGATVISLNNYTPVPAENIIHEFIVVEEDQARGVPWLASALESTGELRDYDAQVLDAARQAADHAVVWYTDHPDAEFLDTNEVCEVERRQQMTGPPGWKPMSIDPKHPTLNYGEYRAERQADLGQPIGMPQMLVRKDAKEANLSTARFVGRIYGRGVDCVREWLERRTLEVLVNDVRREGELYAARNPGWKYAALARPPQKVEYLFIWQPLVQYDPQKDAEEEDMRLKNGTRTFEEACARAGLDMEKQVKKLKQVMQLFQKEEVPLPEWMTAGMKNAGITVGKDGSLKVSGAGQGVTEDSKVEFIRKLILAIAADKSLNDVLFNALDLVDAAKQAGAPTKKDPAIPMMPVLADNGQPVTGEIKAGVGGVAEKPPAPSPAAAGGQVGEKAGGGVAATGTAATGEDA